MNIFTEYTNFILKQFQFYGKQILGKYYMTSIFEPFLTEYINIRYYNIYGKTDNRTIKKSMDTLSETLLSENPEKIKNIAFTMEILPYLTLLDGSLTADEVNKIEKQILLIINKYYSKQEFEISKDYRQYRKRKQDFLNNFESKEFILDVKKHNKYYDVNLNYDINFSDLYSQKAINDIFNNGIINEDKLLVLYNLVGIKVLQDIIDKNYNNNYLVEFNVDIMQKQEKFNRLIKIIDNDISKEKIVFKITEQDFLKNEKSICSLINKGFNFAIVGKLNDNRYLELFKYIVD